MAKLQILGAVLPLDLRVSCGTLPPLRVKVEGNLTFDLSLQILEGKIIAECTTNSTTANDISFICMRTLDAARAAANLVAFASGMGISVHLHTLIYDNGYESPITHAYNYLPRLCTAYPMPATNREHTELIEFLFLQAVADDTFSMALNDLIEAISFPHNGPFNCARALDGLRHLIAPGAPKEDGWSAVQKALNASDGYLRHISKSSERIRHADLSKRESTDVEEIIRRMWILMNRYLILRLGSHQSLSGPEFPLLDS